MLNKKIIIDRLALIKYLYKTGVEQSKQTDPLAAFSILYFHDSIEMFLALLAEHKDVDSKKVFAFMNYWQEFPDLTLIESMRNLNEVRKAIKHKGIHPSKGDIERCRVNTTDFFEQNTNPQFGLNFSEITLLNLIANEDVRKHLKGSQAALEQNNQKLCVEKASVAFEELLRSYEDNKTKYFRNSPFFFGQSFTFKKTSFGMGIKDRKLEDFVDKVGESIEAIKNAMLIMSFGFDYKRYLKFKFLVPPVYRMNDGTYHVQETLVIRKLNVDNCQYCIDFVLDCVLKLQEFDFDIGDLQEIEHPYKINK